MFASPWGTFTVFCTIPIAMVMGIYMHNISPATSRGRASSACCSYSCQYWPAPTWRQTPPWPPCSPFPRKRSPHHPHLRLFCSVLPVWFLLVPRDYLSTYLKIGTIVLLALGIVAVHPQLQMPAITQFAGGGGPVIPGAVFPFIFITIACGALSGFHAIIGTGTTPKMIARERDVLFVGYGAMLTEGFVAIMALIAACTLVPADYFAINSAPKAFEALGMTTVNLPELAREVGEQVQGRPGGAVSLAVGMATSSPPSPS